MPRAPLLVVLLTGVFAGFFFRKKLQKYFASLFQLFFPNPHSYLPPPETNEKPRGTTGDNQLGKRILSDVVFNKIVICFASETGTSESFAHRLSTIIKSRCYADVDVVDIVDVDSTFLLSLVPVGQVLVVFCISTHGEGEPPHNAKKLFKWAKKKTKPNCLEGLFFAMMGLGNSQYVLFNHASKKLNKYLIQLSATPICCRGEGDDDNDIESDFSDWIDDELLPVLDAHTNCKPGKTITGSAHRIPKHWSELEDLRKLVSMSYVNQDRVYDNSLFAPIDIMAKMYFECLYVPISEIRELNQQSSILNKSIKHIEIDLSSGNQLYPSSGKTSINYTTGDTLEILPEQEDLIIEKLFNRLLEGGISTCIDLNSVIGFKAVDSICRCPFPPGFTIRQILKYFCDLHSCPSRNNLRNLSSFIKSDSERMNIDRLLSDNCRDEFNCRIKNNFLNLNNCIDLLMSTAVFHASDQDLIATILMLPRLSPRSYTISSSSLETPSTCSIVVSLLAHHDSPTLATVQTYLRSAGFSLHSPTASSIPRPFFGLCSSDLCLRHNQSLLIRVTPSSFTLPSNHTNILMIGAGTGIAPFRAFLRELSFSSHCHSSSLTTTNERELFGLPPYVVLFYGCAYSSADFLYKDEIELLCRRTPDRPPVITHFFGAFSREQKEKIYVQDRVRQQADLVRSVLVDQSGTVFICGLTKMGFAVREALTDVIGNAEIEKLKTQKRIIEEVWSS